MTDAAPIALTGSPVLDPLLAGSAWVAEGGAPVLRWYLGGSQGAEYLDDGLGGTVLARYPLEGERAAVLAAMQAIEAVSGLRFEEVGSAAEASLVWASAGSGDTDGGLAWATSPGAARVDGAARATIALDRTAYTSVWTDAFLAPGGYDRLVALQALGIALGLATPHPDDVGAGALPGVAAWHDLGADGINQGLHTMMSWNDGWATGPLGLSPDPLWGWEAGPMALDIAALQQLYGANMTTRTGADIYALPARNAAGTGWTCLWDAGGDDRITGAPDRRNVIDLRAATLLAGEGAGGWASYAEGIWGGVTIAHGVVIERAIGGDLEDRLTGNAAANYLAGGGGDDLLLGLDGNDVLDGGAGDDRMEGGRGDDLYWVSSPGDVLVELPGEGTDEVRAALSWVLGAEFENLTLTGAATQAMGNALANKLTGNAADNVLIGLDGDDRLEGGGGADTLEGGRGDDLYVVADALDTILERAGEGQDAVRAAVSFTLPDHVEDLLLTGAATDGTGNALANRLTGNGLANHLRGGDGDDILEGMGGADTLEGGAGNDAYVLTDALDTIVESAGGGTDEVRTWVTLARLPDHVENVVLWGTAAISATGNGLANRMTGNAAANTLLGGDGNDRLDGSKGDDRLEGGAGSDLLQGGRGRDTLTGGPGNDSFLFISPLDGADTLLDWGMAPGDDDRVMLRASAFGLAPGGTLDPALLAVGPTAAAPDAATRFLFRTTDCTLWFDPDGNGGALPTLLADLPDGSVLTPLDLLLVA